MQIYINDKMMQCEDNITLTVLLEKLNQVRPGIALALNRQILPRKQWALYKIQDQDHILIFQVITGG